MSDYDIQTNILSLFWKNGFLRAIKG